MKNIFILDEGVTPPNFFKTLAQLAAEAEAFGYEMSLSHKGAAILKDGLILIATPKYVKCGDRAQSPQEMISYLKYNNMLIRWMLFILDTHKEEVSCQKTH